MNKGKTKPKGRGGNVEIIKALLKKAGDVHNYYLVNYVEETMQNEATTLSAIAPITRRSAVILCKHCGDMKVVIIPFNNPTAKIVYNPQNGT